MPALKMCRMAAEFTRKIAEWTTLTATMALLRRSSISCLGELILCIKGGAGWVMCGLPRASGVVKAW